jgi:hypothetical protein
VIFLALLAAAAGAALVSRIPPSFTSRVVMKVRDPMTETGESSIAPRQLVDNLNHVFFTRAALSSIVSEFDLYPGAHGKALDLALEDMRDRFRIDVLQDYFPGRDEKMVRTTQLVLSFTAEDAEQSLRVARALAGIMAATESRIRQQAASVAVDNVAASQQALRAELERSELYEAELRGRVLAERGSARLLALLELRRAERAAGAVAERLLAIQEIATETSVLLHERELSPERIGLRFELLDSDRLAPAPLLGRREKVALTFCILLVLGVPALGVVIGLLDRRVVNGAGLRRLGLERFGHIPSFPGDRLGSFAARTREKVS